MDFRGEVAACALDTVLGRAIEERRAASSTLTSDNSASHLRMWPETKRLMNIQICKMRVKRTFLGFFGLRLQIKSTDRYSQVG